MQFNALGKAGSGAKKVKKDLPVNLAIRLDRIAMAEGQPSFFHGFVVGSNEPVAIRMMTIDEGVAVNGRKGESLDSIKERLNGQYAGNGEKHRPRPSEIANPNHKAHCEAGGLLMFTKCLKGEDGTYRAHWVETLERTAGAGCDKVVAHIRAEETKDNGKVTGFQVVADVVNPQNAVMLNKGNLMPTLTSAFANRNGEEKRKPFIFVRLVNPETGAVVLPPARASAKYDQHETKDADTGQTFKLFEAASAEDSIKNLFNPENTSQDALVVRAAMFGLGNEPGYPDFKGVENEALIADLKSVVDAVRNGSLHVEVIPGERIGAGPASRASIEKAVKNNPNHPINMFYAVRSDNGYVKERRFCETFLTTQIGKDGYRFFSKAVPADLSPAMRSVAKLATVNDHKATAEAAKARAAEAVATEVEVNDDMVLEPGSLDGSAGADVDTKLAQSASALDASVM